MREIADETVRCADENPYVEIYSQYKQFFDLAQNDTHTLRDTFLANANN
jgi:hypothetical protein